MSTSDWVVIVAAVVLLAVFVYTLPTYIAFKRNHQYKWIILAINAILGASGLGWLIALVWAAWPQEKSLADPLLGNPTGTGSRNVGHTLGEVHASAARTEASNGAGAATSPIFRTSASAFPTISRRAT